MTGQLIMNRNVIRLFFLYDTLLKGMGPDFLIIFEPEQINARVLPFCRPGVSPTAAAKS